MYTYWKCGNLFAAHLEWNSEFGISPFFAIHTCKNEVIIDIPNIRIIVSGSDALNKEQRQEYWYGPHQGLSKDFARIAENRSRISVAIRCGARCDFHARRAFDLLSGGGNQTLLSTASRIVGALSNARQKGEAYGLVHVKISPHERRRKEIYLTPKGHLFINSIDELLENKKTADSAKPRIARAL